MKIIKLDLSILKRVFLAESQLLTCSSSLYFETRTKHLLCGIKGVCLATPFVLHLLDSLMIGNILTKFEKNLLCGFFQGNDPKVIWTEEEN